MATTRFIDIKVRTSSAEKKIDSLDKKMVGLGKATDKTASSFFSLSKVAAGIGTTLITNQITKYSDAYTSLQNQIRQTTKTTADLTKTTADLLGVANRSRTDFQATAELYTQLNLSTENLNLSTEELLRLTETIGKSFAVSGKSAAESSGAIRQLGQAFSAGALRGDEFNSIAEGAPEIMRALQRSLNKTQGELRDFAATGGITAEILVTALGGAADVIDEKMNKAVATLGQSIQEANNNMTDFIGSSTTVQNVVAGAGGALVSASENIELIANSAFVLSSVLAARLIPSMIAYTSGIVANTQAQLLNGVTATRTANIYGVVSVAQARATVTTNALTIASRGLTASMAFLGGPLGIILIAAAALFTFGDEIFSVGEKAELSAEEIDGFSSSIVKMSRAAKGATLDKLNQEAKLVRDQLIATNKQIKAVAESADVRLKNSTLSVLNDRAKELSAQLDIISQKQGLIVAPIDLSGGTNRGDISQGEKDPGVKTSAFANKLAQETEQLRLELELRKAVRDGFITEEVAEEAARITETLTAQQSKFDAELLKLGEDELLRADLKAQFREQQLLTVQEFEQNLTDIELQAVSERTENEIAANQRVVQSKQQTHNALVGLLSVFAGKSKAAAIALLAIQKGHDIASTLSGALAGSVKVFGELPYPAALAASGQILAQGKITAGLIAATGIAQGAGILSGGSSVSTSSPIGGGTSINTGQQQVATLPTQTRAIDIRVPDDALLTGTMFRDAMSAILQTDDDIIIDINNSQTELTRIGG